RSSIRPCAADRCPRLKYSTYEGKAILARIAITATAIINSISVKPSHRDPVPIAVRDPIPRRRISVRPPVRGGRGDNIAGRLVLCGIDIEGSGDLVCDAYIA